MFKRVVIASLLGLSLVVPAWADDITDDQAEIAAAKQTEANDKVQQKLDKKNKASKSVLIADKAQLKADKDLITALMKDLKHDRKVVSPSHP